MNRINFGTLKNGNILKIANKKFEVVNTTHDINLTKKDRLEQKEFIRVELHELKSKSLHPTHELHYFANNEIWLAEVNPTKRPPAWVKLTRSQGAFFVENHKKIKLETISLE